MKKIALMITLIISIFALSGCIKLDNMDDINIVTTVYPITYLTNEIYGDNSTIVSIYPNGINSDEYEITDKQIKEYSKYDLFIYNGLDAKEKKIATRLLNENKNIKLIDATQGLTINSAKEELWLSPANFLMMAQNIKEHLSDDITSTLLKNNVDKNYEQIKLKISMFDANLKIIAENARTKDVIIANNSLQYLSRYGFNIVSLDNSENTYKSNLTKAKNNINTETNKTIFAVDNNINDDIKNINVKVTNVRSMTILTVDEVNDKDTYETMMNEFIEELRTEVY